MKKAKKKILYIYKNTIYIYIYIFSFSFLLDKISAINQRSLRKNFFGKNLVKFGINLIYGEYFNPLSTKWMSPCRCHAKSYRMLHLESSAFLFSNFEPIPSHWSLSKPSVDIRKPSKHILTMVWFSTFSFSTIGICLKAVKSYLVNCRKSYVLVS